MITGAPLEDARHLAQRYSRMRHEAELQVKKRLVRKWVLMIAAYMTSTEAELGIFCSLYNLLRHVWQVAEISRRQLRAREAPFPENTAKLQSSEAKMHEHKANMAVLGKEAAAALAAVESQQQRLTLQRLVALVKANVDKYLSSQCFCFFFLF